MAFRCEEHNKDFPTRRGLANHLRWDKGIMEYCRQISKQAYAKNKNFQDRQRNQPRGEKSPSWKGDKAGLSALHIWVKKNLIKPQTCQDCNQPKPLDLANISQEYKRDLSDWEWLCRSCHMKKDGRLEKLFENHRLTIKGHFVSEETRKKMSEANKRYALLKKLKGGE